MKIFRYPDPILLQKAEPVTPGKEADAIVKKLLHAVATVKWGKPAGMAAPQIGINKQVFIVGPQAFLNPRIVGSETPYDSLEGCYSLEPGKYDYKAKRYGQLELEWTDVNGKLRRQNFIGGLAKIIGHEYDHLQGELCGS